MTGDSKKTFGAQRNRSHAQPEELEDQKPMRAVPTGSVTAQKERGPGSGSQGVGQVSLVLGSGLKYVFHWLRSQNWSVFLLLALVSDPGWVSSVGRFILQRLFYCCAVVIVFKVFHTCVGSVPCM